MGVSLEKYCGPVPETAKSKWKFCRLYNPLYMRTYKTAAPERTGSTKKLKISEKKKKLVGDLIQMYYEYLPEFPLEKLH